MKNNTINKELANRVYDLLVSLGGADESERQSFIYHHCDSKDGCDEWRFRGKLGFGGKYRSTTNTVTCYQEDETPQIMDTIVQINTALDNIKLASN